MMADSKMSRRVKSYPGFCNKHLKADSKIGTITWEACYQCRHADDEGACTFPGLSDKETSKTIEFNTSFTSIYCNRFEARE